MKKILIAVLIILIILPVGAYFGADYLFKKRLHAFVEEMGLQNSLTWTDAGLNIFTRKATVTGITFSNLSKDITADKVTLFGYSYASPVPKALSSRIDNLSISVTEEIFGRWADAFTEAGYSHLALSGTVSMNHSGDGNLELNIVDLDIANAGTLNTRMAYNNLTGRSLAEVVKAIPSAPMVSLWLRFKDDGNTATNVVKLFAKDTNADFDIGRTRILSGINRRIQTQFKPDSDERKKLAQIYRYFDSPDTITIQLQDGETITLNQLLPDEDVIGWRSLASWATDLPVTISSN